MNEHWSEVFGTMESQAEIIARAQANGLTLIEQLEQDYNELSSYDAPAYAGGWEPNRYDDNDFAAFAAQIEREAQS